MVLSPTLHSFYTIPTGTCFRTRSYSLVRIHAIPPAFDKMRIMPELPIVCTLSPDALRTRRAGLLTELLKRSARHELLQDGLRMVFAPSGETLSSITRAIEAERHCRVCNRFKLTVEPDEGQFALELTGPQGTREFVAALLDM